MPATVDGLLIRTFIDPDSSPTSRDLAAATGHGVNPERSARQPWSPKHRPSQIAMLDRNPRPLLGARESLLEGPRRELTQPLQVAGAAASSRSTACVARQVRAGTSRRARVEPRAQRELGLDLEPRPTSMRASSSTRTAITARYGRWGCG